MATSTPFVTAVGRRKTAVASVRIVPADAARITVNGRRVREYFKTPETATIAEEALAAAGSTETYAVTARVDGGGVSAQAEALRHAISRAVSKAEPATRATLKAASFLTRDARAKERKKPGLVKARKRKTWSKR